MTHSILEHLVEAYGLKWAAFKDSMDEIDKEAFISLSQHAMIHADAGLKIENPDLSESIVISILVEHQREMQLLQKQLSPIKTKTCPRCGRMASLEDFLLCSRCKKTLNYH